MTNYVICAYKVMIHILDMSEPHSLNAVCMYKLLRILTDWRVFEYCLE